MEAMTAGGALCEGLNYDRVVNAPGSGECVLNVTLTPRCSLMRGGKCLRRSIEVRVILIHGCD